MTYKLKIIVGVLLLICTCLPLGSCQDKEIGFNSRTVNTQSVDKSIDTENSIPSKAQTKPDYLIPVMQIEISAPDTWILFIAFIWPIPFLIVSKKIFNTVAKRRIVLAIELFLAISSAFVIYSFIFELYYTPMLFGYLAFILICGYILLNFFEIAIFIKGQLSTK